MVEKDKEYTKLGILKEFFGDVMPLEMTEVRALGMPGVNELAQAVAAEFGAKIKKQ